MANSSSLVDKDPSYLPNGLGPVEEHEVVIDTTGSDYTLKTGITGKRFYVIGLLLNNAATATVILTSGSSKSRTTALTLNQPLSGYLFYTKSGEDLKIQSNTATTSLIVRLIEAESVRVDSVLSMGLGSGGGASGTSGTTGATSSASGMGNVIPMLQYNTTAPAPTNGQLVNAQSDSAGNQKVNPGIYNGVPTETSVSVATSSTQILAANASRTFLFIQNQDGTNPIYVATDGNAAVADGTCTKIVAGSSRTWENGFIPNGAVFGIATGGTVTTHVEEAS